MHHCPHAIESLCTPYCDRTSVVQCVSVCSVVGACGGWSTESTECQRWNRTRLLSYLSELISHLSTVLLYFYGGWNKTVTSMRYCCFAYLIGWGDQNTGPREIWRITTEHKEQPSKLGNNRSKNCREELKSWCHHDCGLTARSFPAHLHSSRLEGVAGHGICANKGKRQSHTMLEEERRDLHVVSCGESEESGICVNDFGFVSLDYPLYCTWCVNIDILYCLDTGSGSNYRI